MSPAPRPCVGALHRQQAGALGMAGLAAGIYHRLRVCSKVLQSDNLAAKELVRPLQQPNNAWSQAHACKLHTAPADAGLRVTQPAKSPQGTHTAAARLQRPEQSSSGVWNDGTPLTCQAPPAPKEDLLGHRVVWRRAELGHHQRQRQVLGHRLPCAAVAQLHFRNRQEG